jgi:hypothetical protein
MRNLTALVIVPAALLVVIGCDLASIDPGGGAVSETVVSLRGGIEADDGGGGATDVIPTEVLTGDPGSITGTILFDGTVPSLPAKVRNGASKVDKAICAASEDIPDESLVVSKAGGIANVFVYLSKKPKGVKFDPPESQPFLDQEKCIFAPRGLLLRSGVEFELKNSDKVAHNVATYPGSNAGSNNSMPPGSSMKSTYRNAEQQPFQSKCAIHPWMEFWTLVVDHPYAAVTDADGKFEIPNLPPGKYKFRVFHERGKLLERGVEIVVQPEAETKVEWKYAAGKFGL